MNEFETFEESRAVLFDLVEDVIKAHATGDFYDRGRKVHDLIPKMERVINQIKIAR